MDTLKYMELINSTQKILDILNYMCPFLGTHYMATLLNLAPLSKEIKRKIRQPKMP